MPRHPLHLVPRVYVSRKPALILSRRPRSSPCPQDQRDRLTVLEMLHHPWVTMFQRRASVRMVHARSDSLRQLVPHAPGADTNTNTSNGVINNTHGGDIAGAPYSRQHSASRSRHESGNGHVPHGTHGTYGTHAVGGGGLSPSPVAAEAQRGRRSSERSGSGLLHHSMHGNGGGRRSYERSSLAAAANGGGGGPHSGSGMHVQAPHSGSHQHQHAHQQDEDQQQYGGPLGSASGGTVRRASRLALMAGVGDTAGGGGVNAVSLRASAERMRLTRMAPREGSEY